MAFGSRTRMASLKSVSSIIIGQMVSTTALVCHRKCNTTTWSIWFVVCGDLQSIPTAKDVRY